MTYIFIPHVSKDMFVVARVANKFTLGKISLFTLEILRVGGGNQFPKELVPQIITKFVALQFISLNSQLLCTEVTE